MDNGHRVGEKPTAKKWLLDQRNSIRYLGFVDRPCSAWIAYVRNEHLALAIRFDYQQQRPRNCNSGQLTLVAAKVQDAFGSPARRKSVLDWLSKIKPVAGYGLSKGPIRHGWN